MQPLGPLTLDDARTQTLLRLLVPEKTSDLLTTENLGRIRIDGVAMAYCQDPKTGADREFIHLEGLALDGRKRIIETVRRMSAEKVQVAEAPGIGGGTSVRLSGGTSFRLSGAALPFALEIFDDNHVFLARSFEKPEKDKEPPHRKALEQLRSSPTILNGYNPPWVTNALNAVPFDAFGLFIGEIPVEWRKILTEVLRLRICPRTFTCYLSRRGNEIAVTLSLNVDKAGTDGMLRDDLVKWRLQGLDILHARYPALRKEPQALALVGQTLKNMRWDAKGGSVRTEVHVSDPTWKALATLLRRASQKD